MRFFVPLSSALAVGLILAGSAATARAQVPSGRLADAPRLQETNHPALNLPPVAPAPKPVEERPPHPAGPVHDDGCGFGYILVASGSDGAALALADADHAPTPMPRATGLGVLREPSFADPSDDFEFVYLGLRAASWDELTVAGTPMSSEFMPGLQGPQAPTEGAFGNLKLNLGRADLYALYGRHLYTADDGSERVRSSASTFLTEWQRGASFRQRTNQAGRATSTQGVVGHPTEPTAPRQ